MSKVGKIDKSLRSPPTPATLVRRACQLAQISPSSAAINLAAKILAGQIELPDRDVLQEAWRILDGGAALNQPVYPLAAIGLRTDWVTQEDLRAAVRYVELSAVIYDRGPGISAFVRQFSGLSVAPPTRGTIDPTIEAQYAAMSRALDALGSPGRSYFDSVVIGHLWPGWLRSGHVKRPRDDQEREWLKGGLRAIRDALNHAAEK